MKTDKYSSISKISMTCFFAPKKPSPDKIRHINNGDSLAIHQVKISTPTTVRGIKINLSFWILYQIKRVTHSHPLLKIVAGSLVFLPSPARLRAMWNFGSLLGLCLTTQLLSGLFLAIHYSCDITIAFESVSHISRDVNRGWLLRSIHANGARFFFICVYLHVARGVYYGSYHFKETWRVGVVILLLLMGTAFLGYVLPWGQMSFWGATVITNLASAIPVVGNEIVLWLWGGFSVRNATLTRFFTLHFLLPFIIRALRIVHLLFLHQTGSSNPIGVNRNLDKTPFHPYFSSKDLFGFVVFFGALVYICILHPWDLGDPENFIPANPIVTPVHIQPEWYFLFAYAILRSIPRKLGGVLALALSVVILIIIPWYGAISYKRRSFNPVAKFRFWVFICVVVLLTWIGARPVEAPYIETGQVLTVVYFTYFIMLPVINKF